MAQTKDFFARLRAKVKDVKGEITTKVKESQSLSQLQGLIDSNQEYFGQDAGSEITREKEKFDMKLQKGRYASVVKNQEFYQQVISTLD